VAIIYRWAENQIGQLTELAVELVHRKVALIVAFVGAALAAKAATTTIPIVFLAGEDPVRLGLVASLARPGGNATGINVLSGELVAKRLELLRELVPGATRVAVLVNPTDAESSERSARHLKLSLRRGQRSLSARYVLLLGGNRGLARLDLCGFGCGSIMLGDGGVNRRNLTDQLIHPRLRPSGIGRYRQQRHCIGQRVVGRHGRQRRV
jgi:hypothetical protein